MSKVTDIIRDTAQDTIGLLRSGAQEIRSGVQLIETWRIGIAQFPIDNYRTLAIDGYRKNELVYACIREIATSVSEAPFRIGAEVRGVVVPVNDHPGFELVNDPNPMMTGFEYWETILTLQNIAGKSYVWKERNDRDRPINLWILRPDWVRFRPAKDITKSMYFYAPDGSFDSKTVIPIPLADMIPYRHGVDPLNLYTDSLSPLRVVFRNTILDNNATDFMKVFFDNAGAPMGIIKVAGKLKNQREANRIRKRWQERYSGLSGWHSPAVMDEDASYEKVGLDFREMAVDVLRDVPETRICMGFGVPPILVGANVGLKRSTYTNYPAAKVSFWDETLSPIFQKLATATSKYLIDPEFPTDIPVKAFFDTSNVRALREDKTALWRRATQALQVGGITINMFLQEIGREPLDGMDVFLIPTSKEPLAVKVTGRALTRTLLETMGEVRYHQLFDITDHKLLQEVNE